MLTKVVFPAPFSPRRARTSPRPTSRVTPRLATTGPKRLVMFSSRNMERAEAPGQEYHGKLGKPTPVPSLFPRQGTLPGGSKAGA
ncbi:hypothetical protein TbrSNM41_10150 [Thermus brockianus]|uniref:Uncharacterized protein n=1 Tax=Thermus brockianus TaxID=56956 RepID=A0ABM7XIZ7_THEBO|nr:hypothetical protein TbrSNM41_10150 [Thermus brockianus]